MARTAIGICRRWLATATVCSLLAGAALAQPPEAAPIQAVPLLPGEHLRLDGTMSHPAWQRAPAFTDNWAIEPVRFGPVTHPTRVQVLYDDRALWIGVTAIDPEPQNIRAPLVRHDYVFRTQDFVVVYIDPMGTRRSAQFFRVNAAGSTSDGLHTAENDGEDFSPDFDFDAATARNENGYTAVFRIPYSSLRFTSSHANTWRVMVARRVPREQVALTLTVPLPADALSFIDRLQPLQGFVPPQNHAFLQLRPTLTARRSTDGTEGGPSDGASALRLSLDAKWSPRPELVLDATLQPDFSQVELDVPQLARNTRFALFLTEKRPFFLESSDLLTTPTNALYTRSVNDPRWGVRASWRGDAVAGTALAVSDKGGGLTLLPGAYGTDIANQPANETLMARARADRGPVSFGGSVSARRYAGGAGENTVVGADGQWLVTEQIRLKAQFMRSRTTALPDGSGGLAMGPALSGSRALVDAYGRTEHLELGATVDDLGAGFRDDAGFVSQVGVRRTDARVAYNWFSLGEFNQFQVYVNGSQVTDRDGGRTAAQRWVPGIWGALPGNTEIDVELVVSDKLRVGPGTPLRSQSNVHAWAQTTPATWAPLVEAWIDRGRIVDVNADRLRPGTRLGTSARLRPLGPLELEPRVEALRLDADGGGWAYREVAARLLAVWHLAPRQTLRLIAQRSRYDHIDEPGVAGFSGSSMAQSLTYTWRRSAGTVLHVGASRSRDQALPDAAQRGSEVFVKLQFDVDEIRR